MIAALIAGALAGYGIALPVGAVSAYLVALASRTSWRVACSAALGVATTDGLYALVAVVAGRVLVELIAEVATPLRWMSVLVLVALAARIAVAGVREYRAGSKQSGEARQLTPLRAYGVLVGITAVNPTTVVYFAALVLGNTAVSAAPIAQQAVFVAAAFAASASWQLVLASGGVLLGAVLTGPRARLLTALASGAVMLLLAGLMF
ncbi:LysE family transporter [Saccharopolyspora sp. K220]|uniref:LysE family transporter n=1 Tax=Saccharopolyspora soli TaxID=2926618 RepID=UPI001F57E2CC|nr:LysE family transporter [Saccharopolyspora soli]MCI2416330.1 LysE family transporter [Saccharopolyspora soli]